MGHRSFRIFHLAASLALGTAGCGGPSGDAGVTAANDGDASAADASDSGAPSGGADAGALADSGSTPKDSGATDSGGPPLNDASAPGKPVVPTPVGACPTFQAGTVTFNPAAGARTVRLYLNPSTPSKRGPLVLYWYATYGSPAQATQALGTALATIESLGGIVAAPADNGTGQFPWIDNVAAHMLLADEIVGCAAAANIDTTHIHSLGFSAGALMTTQLAFGRSSYLASVATYSGGLTSANAPAWQDPSNRLAALVLTGGTSDNVFNTDFRQASLDFQAKLKGDGHSALYCDHGGGHTIPLAYTAAVGQFFLDHPFGTNPSPYIGALPPALKGCTF